ncbi:MAG TPA: 2-oxoacid:acceptor oxidoreductase subunit alpha [Candidatus Binatia bacterium]|jgi:2-oxoglutarate ferredoxin oxidoreductase subunit alpha|nr:2-oxoacid:acceptor oxidoreductase subunit alpha [Candidatus Binatia bacterium]
METPPINDLSISIATENGTGSASANNVLFKAIFKMGVPCSSKNMFPSNIQGLPTWYQIRASAEGYMARKDVIDVMVMFNDATAAKDIYRVRDGGIIIHDDSNPLASNLKRDGVQYFGVPANKLIQKIVPASPLRIKQRNMVYVGALAYLFGIDIETIKEVLQDTFGKKPAVIESNLVCIQAGFNHMKEKGYTQNIARLQTIPNGNKGKIITEGNTACALGAIFGGASVVSWYPITPSSSLAEAVEHYMPRLRKKDGKATYAIVQAEDEIAAASMIVGAGWAGVRAMTSTSGPGLSLMNESIGLAYFAEVPCVFFIIQRGGPSTGLPTRTQQADIQLMYYASHGDTRHLILIPHDMKSCFDMARRSFDFAERFQTPVFVMMDLDLGMNLWSSEPLKLEKEPFDRGKILTAEQIEQWEKQGKKFRRYFDFDGDGIPYRTLPGNPNRKAAYFTRGSGHDADARYSEDEKDYKETLDRLRKKFETARKYVPKPAVEKQEGVKTGIISFGSSYEPVREARDRLRASGLKTNHLLLRALPLTEETKEFLEAHEVIYLVEQNRDAQMASIVKDEWPELASKITSILVYDGLPLTTGEVVRQINQHRAGGRKGVQEWQEKKLIA